MSEKQNTDCKSFYMYTKLKDSFTDTGPSEMGVEILLWGKQEMTEDLKLILHIKFHRKHKKLPEIMENYGSSTNEGIK